ncbi:DUF3574 domain-containing protein [Methylocaldum szegediense]|uniref:DUF3574 domain-containing protein n=1 Tax=Methylocaldum szegediense TaxID=73780 RepID=A0ABN8XFJ6_9GAMM|nr:DUF3574 domain-containing protein [Methylocaldum szegediense]CAI8982397.1 conserved protein of unknown function [Methylocaldum szegediense]
MRLGAVMAAVLSFAIEGCATDAGRVCRPGELAATIETLYFGTGRKGADPVASEEWREFMSQVVTPRFPQGLTWWKAQGQWRNDAGVIERERAYVLQVVHPDAESVEPAIRDVAKRYREKFDQESVLRVSSPTCLSFLKSTLGSHE